jgi:two-component system chemotaxis response regulator CheY
VARGVLSIGGMQPRKVLVVDDSRLLHKMYDVVLGRFTLVHALDGREALARLVEHPDIDLVLLDINMPNMNGIEVLQRVRAEPMHAQVRIVVVSTEGQDEDVARARQAGAAGYVRKPFRGDDLLHVIQSLDTRAA